MREVMRNAGVAECGSGCDRGGFRWSGEDAVAERWRRSVQDAVTIAICLRSEGHTPAESRAKIEKAFQQLFHGDGQEERLYFETGANENGHAGLHD